MCAWLDVTLWNVVKSSTSVTSMLLPRFCCFSLLGTVTDGCFERLWERFGSGKRGLALVILVAVVSSCECVEVVLFVVNMEKSFTIVSIYGT